MYCVCVYGMYVCTYCSRMAQWKRAGPITQRSVDQNYLLLETFFTIFFYQVFVPPPYMGAKKNSKIAFRGGTILVMNHCLLLGH